jgi:hypothetical protein
MPRFVYREDTPQPEEDGFEDEYEDEPAPTPGRGLWNSLAGLAVAGLGDRLARGPAEPAAEAAPAPAASAAPAPAAPCNACGAEAAALAAVSPQRQGRHRLRGM